MIRQLGLPPVAGLLVNLAYSSVAVVIFSWAAQRWLRARKLFTEESDHRTYSAEH
jgi:hypothetical protein